MAEPILTVEGLAAGYGDVRVLWDINLAVAAGEITCIVGSNGAGKTTLLRTISGLVPAASGRIAFQGEDTTALAPDQILGRGIAHVPEGRRLFRGLERARQSSARRLPAQGHRRGAARPRLCVHAVPDPQGSPQAGRNHAVRRRAADVRDRARNHVAAEASDDRRAVAGPRATAGRTAERSAARDQPQRADHSAGRAGRDDGVRDRAPRADHRDRACQQDRQTAALADDPSIRQAYLGI